MGEQITRKPILLLPLSLLLRLAERTLFDVLFQEPPRKTREALSEVPDSFYKLLKQCA